MGIKEYKNRKDQILVVDDQPENLKIIASILSPEYALSIANNGMNALKILEKSIPDLILLDIMMPEMDGFEVCKKIRENKKTKDIPIIFLTAKTALEDIIKGFDSGAVDYITKPFNPAEMSVRVKNHLNLYHAKQEIEQINKEKDKFFSIIAHDLRSPFIAIVGFSKLLMEKANRNDLKGISKYAEIILNSSELVLDLQTNLMDWAQAQTGRMEFNPEHFEINKLINEIALLYQDIARTKSIRIQEELPQNISAFADKAMISTVIRNLVSNALKYTMPGGSVTITTSAGEQTITVSVTDTGVGIPEETIAKLFRIDENHSTPGTHDEMGTGLGLILCKEFVERHGGEISVESKEGTGSTFRFTISG
jgi:signal transduction histidine kinase